MGRRITLSRPLAFLYPETAFQSQFALGIKPRGGTLAAGGHSQPLAPGIFGTTARTLIDIARRQAQQRVCSGATSGADSLGFFAKIAVMVEMNQVDHFVLESIVDFPGKKLVVSLGDDDLVVVAQIETGGQETAGIPDLRCRQFAGEILDIEQAETVVKLIQ